MTVNCSYYQKDYEFDGTKYTFCLWDTAGQEKFNALTNIYYRDAKGAILVYDVTLKESFSRVEKWYEELKVFNSDTIILVAGNKTDLNKFDIDKKLVEEYCNKIEVEHIFTSAKTGEGLDDVFYIICKNIANKIKLSTILKKNKKALKVISDRESLSLNNKPEKLKDNCC